MILKSKIRNSIINTICWLYATLFIYAATSKLIDFGTFRLQLGQSPLLSSFADWIALMIPTIEIGIALLLLNSKFRVIGLFGSFTLMIIFTVYIYIILNYSAFVPCSCGGILEKMTWNQHLTFNIIFVILAVWAIILIPDNDYFEFKKSNK